MQPPSPRAGLVAPGLLWAPSPSPSACVQLWLSLPRASRPPLTMPGGLAARSSPAHPPAWGSWGALRFLRALGRAVVCHGVLCLVVPCHAVPCCATLCHTVPFLVVPHCAMPCRVVPCLVVPCHAVPCHTVPRRAMPCRVVLHCAVPCSAAPRCTACPAGAQHHRPLCAGNGKEGTRGWPTRRPPPACC